MKREKIKRDEVSVVNIWFQFVILKNDQMRSVSIGVSFDCIVAR